MGISHSRFFSSLAAVLHQRLSRRKIHCASSKALTVSDSIVKVESVFGQ